MKYYIIPEPDNKNGLILFGLYKSKKEVDPVFGIEITEEQFKALNKKMKKYVKEVANYPNDLTWCGEIKIATKKEK